MRKFDSADNAEIGKFGAIGPGTWQANFVHSVELHDFEISSEQVMQKSFVQGCFDLRIETVTAVDEHSRLVLKGTDADAPFTVETPRFDLVDWVSRNTPFSHRHRDEYGRTMVEGDACWLCMRTKNEILSITTTLKGNIDILVPAIIIVVIQVAQIGGYTKLAALHCSDIIAVQLSDIKASQKKTPGSIGDLATTRILIAICARKTMILLRLT